MSKEKESIEKKVNSNEKAFKKPSKTKLKKEIKDLLTELNDVDSDLEQLENSLISLKNLRHRELNNKEDCIAYLQRILKSKTNECLRVHNELQSAKDLKELTEYRASDLSRNIDRNRLISKSLFSQQKSELEGKLFALEEKRLEKNNQLSTLKRLKEELADKISNKRGEEREKNRMRVSRLLEKREKFEQMVENLCSDSTEVFDLSLPVYAKKQIYDNVRLRRLCEEVSENLLVDQDCSRHLTKLENSLKVKSEAQDCVESASKTVQVTLNRRLEFLLEEDRKLQLDFITSSVGDDFDDKKRDLTGIREELWRVNDELEDVSLILQDQREHKRVLQEELDRKIDRNGRMTSIILTAGKMVHSRIKEIGGKEYSYMDFELLGQIRMLLEGYLSTTTGINKNKCLSRDSQ